MSQHEGTITVTASALQTYCEAVLARCGVAASDAATVGQCLVYANLRGVDSHGVVRLPFYIERLRQGVVATHPVITVQRVARACVLVDGDNGLGAVIGNRALHEAVALAEECGIGLAGVVRSNHFGPASFYVEQAVDRGYIGLACSNVAPYMAPWGGKKPFLGTNPIAVGVPAGSEPPIILDMATSVVARGRIILAAQQGETIPVGWAVDADGLPTTDAAAALLGAVLPFGGPKGSAIAFIIDALSGAWTGAGFDGDVYPLEDLHHTQNLGHVILVARADLFMPMAMFTKRIDELVRALRASPPASGVPAVLAPGDLELAMKKERQRNGIPIADEVWTQLKQLAQETGVAMPDVVST